MKVAVTAPTGNIGRALTSELLARGAEVVLLARDPSKVKEFTDKSATVHQGALEDENHVVDATKGVDALFWLTPPNFSAPDFRGYQKKLAGIAAAAVTTNKIPRVVDLSSIGAQHPSGTGPIAGLYDVEKALDGTGAHVTHLRPSYFMENLFASAEGIARDGAIFMPIPGDAAFPMIATADIARAAADRILDDSWTGRTVIELMGPTSVSMNEVAEKVGKAIGKKIGFVTVTPEQAKGALKGMGVSDDLADLYVEMYGAFGSGKIVPETSSPVKTSTTIDSFVENVFRPGFETMTK